MSTTTATTAPRWTIRDVARYWGISATSVRRAVERGDLRAHRIGRLIRFDPAEVKAAFGCVGTEEIEG